MPTAARGGLRVFRLVGIDVYVHWSWAVVALIELQTRVNHYRSQAYNVAEYLALFLIVLTHEFGHALACRSVGGKADRILLWPLGGVAYVQPPPRPGALLWSIAAGPLVNLFLAVALTPFAFTLLAVKGELLSDPMRLLEALWIINIVLFLFNMLPVYPLDGGQIVRAILWFFVGPSRSLMVVSVVGICAAAVVFALAAAKASIWWGAMAVFAGMRAMAGMKAARAMAAMAGAPRRQGFACPACNTAPPAGPFWRCPCGNMFDTFASQAKCPRCGRAFATTSCPTCQQARPFAEWPRGSGVRRDGSGGA